MYQVVPEEACRCQGLSRKCNVSNSGLGSRYSDALTGPLCRSQPFQPKNLAILLRLNELI